MSKRGDFDDSPRHEAADWLRLVEQALKGASLDTLASRTRDGIAVQPLEPAAIKAPELGREARRWTVMQRADMPAIGAANRQMQEDLALGADGITLVLPSSLAAQGHGVEASDRDRLGRLLEGIDIDLIHLRLDAGHRGFAVTPLLLALYRERGIDLSRVRLTLGLDPLASAGGKALATAREAGHVGSLFLADGRSYHNAGATEGQELALSLATAAEAVRHLSGDVMPRIGILLAADANLFLTVAKFRAARLLWHAPGARLGIASPPPLDLHGETSWRMMTKQDPQSNLLRVALATMGAGLGGADHVTALPYSAALGLADRFARRMARNTQTILLEESRMAAVADPTRGSGHVEALTASLVEKALEILDAIEADGGMMAALRSGKVQAMVADAAARQRAAVAQGAVSIIGVTQYPHSSSEGAVALDMPGTADWSDRSDSSLTWERLAEGVEAPAAPIVRRQEEVEPPILKARFKPSEPPHITPEGIVLKPAYGPED